ncbi:MAG: zinc ribbon domain-containing protein [Candidatus Thorarchaeota archaeon]
MKVNVIYEDSFQIAVERAFELTMQWLKGRHKAKIKESTPPKYIEAKQGTMMTNTGHDPNWKKRIRINFYELERKKTLIRVEATPIARNVFRVEKLKQSWFNGFFSHLFSLLQTIEKQQESDVIPNSNFETVERTKYCSHCGKKVEEKTLICPDCGIDLF